MFRIVVDRASEVSRSNTSLLKSRELNTDVKQTKTRKLKTQNQKSRKRNIYLLLGEDHDA